MLHRFPLASVMVIGMAVTFCGLAGCDRTASQNPGSAQNEGVPVEVAHVRAKTLRETIRGIGTLRAAETVEIKPEIDGFIRDIPFEEGGEVLEGQLLFSIDDRKLTHQLTASKAALEAARVRLADAKRRLDRMQELLERGSADQDELDETETESRAAAAEVSRMEAEVELDEARLDDASLMAPFDGIISERSVDVGDYVKAGDHLATLYRVSRMEIAFTVPERFMGRVQCQQNVMVRVSAYPDRQFDGEVYFVSPQVDESTRDFLVKAAVTLDVREGQPVIPEEALVATREGYMIFVVEDQAAKSRDVRIGLREMGWVEIREGLELGEQVVRLGQMNLSDGTRIRVVQSNDE